MSISFLLHSQLDVILRLLGRDPSLTGRADVWESVSALAEAKPLFGQGHVFWAIDSAERDAIWTELGWAAPHAHNMFLDIKLQLGLIGVIIAVIFLQSQYGGQLGSYRLMYQYLYLFGRSYF